jgi:hypothetical protein
MDGASYPAQHSSIPRCAEPLRYVWAAPVDPKTRGPVLLFLDTWRYDAIRTIRMGQDSRSPRDDPQRQLKTFSAGYMVLKCS